VPRCASSGFDQLEGIEPGRLLGHAVRRVKSLASHLDGCSAIRRRLPKNFQSLTKAWRSGGFPGSSALCLTCSRKKSRARLGKISAHFPQGGEAPHHRPRFAK